jgi:predicted metal-dependent enzyme (double-stranded beta helix superfamily)
LAFALSPRDVGALSAAFETQVGALHAEYAANAARIDRVVASAASHAEESAPSSSSSSSPALAVAVIVLLMGAHRAKEASRGLS